MHGNLTVLDPIIIFARGYNGCMVSVYKSNTTDAYYVLAKKDDREVRLPDHGGVKEEHLQYIFEILVLRLGLQVSSTRILADFNIMRWDK